MLEVLDEQMRRIRARNEEAQHIREEEAAMLVRSSELAFPLSLPLLLSVLAGCSHVGVVSARWWHIVGDGSRHVLEMPRVKSTDFDPIFTRQRLGATASERHSILESMARNLLTNTIFDIPSHLNGSTVSRVAYVCVVWRGHSASNGLCSASRTSSRPPSRTPKRRPVSRAYRSVHKSLTTVGCAISARWGF